jgi:microcystin-dependent protein
MTGFNWAPAGWALCNGQQLPISEYETLFNLIGTTYGGDGQETFNLPNLSSRFPMHRGNTQLGESGGVESVTLSGQQVAQHNHMFLATTALGSQGTPGNVAPAQSPTVQYYAEDAASSPMAGGMIGPTGGNQPHENMHPFQAVNFIISLFGIYPPPN